MARFGTLGTQYFDAAGDPLVDGKIYFYESNTTTPKNTYKDVNLTIANANPVILGGDGTQGNIFFNGTAKAILTDKDDVQIDVKDPIGETGSNFGDEWIPTKTYSQGDVVRGSDGNYYESASNGNTGNDPTVQPSTVWFDPISVAWQSAKTYSINDTAAGSDGNFYRSLTNGNKGNDPVGDAVNWESLASRSGAADVTSATGATLDATKQFQRVNMTASGQTNVITDPAIVGFAMYVIANVGSNDFAVEDDLGEFLGTAETGVTYVYSKTDGSWSVAKLEQMPGIESTTPSVFESAATTYVAMCLLDTDKYLLTYQDQGNSNHGTAVVLSKSGDVLTPGTPFVFEATSTSWTDVEAISTTQAVVAYSDNTNCVGQVLDISGTTITGNTKYSLETSSAIYDNISVSVLSSTLGIVVTENGLNQNKAAAFSITGTVLAAGTAVALGGANSNYPDIIKVDATTALAAYEDGSATDGEAAVLTISGTTITIQTPAAFSSNSTSFHIMAAATEGSKYVVAYKDSGAYSACVLDVSGNTVTPGTAVSIASVTGSGCTLAALSSTEFVMTYDDQTAGDLKAVLLTVSGSSISAGTPVSVHAGSVYTPAGHSHGAAPVDASSTLVAYGDGNNSNFGSAQIIKKGAPL